MSISSRIPVLNLGYSEAVEETERTIIAVPPPLQHLQVEDGVKIACNMLLSMLSQQSWNEGADYFFETLRYYIVWAWRHRRNRFMRIVSPKPQPTHSRDVDKQDLNAPLSKRCASVSLFMPWIPILDGLLVLDLPL